MDGLHLCDELGVRPDLCCTVTPVMMSQESTGTFPGRESLSQSVQTSEMLKGTLPFVELTSLPSFPGGGGLSAPETAFTAVGFSVFPHCSSFDSLILGRRVCYFYPEPWQKQPGCSRLPYSQSLSELAAMSRLLPKTGFPVQTTA